MSDPAASRGSGALRQLRVSVSEAGADLRRRWGPGSWSWVAALALAAAAPLVLPSTEQVRAMAAGLYVALAATGLNFAVGMAGMPSLAQGAFVGVGAFGAIWLRARAGWDPTPAILAGVALSTAAGLAVAVGVARLRGAFVAVATWLVSWIVALGLAAFPGISGGAQGTVVAEGTLGLERAGVAVRLTPVLHFELALGLLALTLLAYRVSSKGPAGLGLAAARQAPASATAIGVRGARLRRGAFVASAGIGGLAGALGVHLAGVADPTAYGPLLSVELFVAVLIGGAGTTLGPVVGAVALAVIPPAAEGLGSVAGIAPERFEPVVASVLLVVALIAGGRGGIVRLAARAFARPASPRRTAGAEPADALPLSGPPPAHSAPRPREKHESGEPAATSTLLAVESLSKRFGGVVALDGVSFEVRQGHIHALIGPNGSGKTTCLRVLSGTMPADGGTVTLGGTDVTGSPTARLVELGLVRTFARTTVFEDLTGLEHALAGTVVRRRFGGAIRTLFATPLARREATEEREEARQVLRAVGLEHLASKRAEALTGAEQRLLMLATAYATRPRMLLMDEPSSGLSPADAERLATILAGLRDRGVTLLLVEHNVGLVWKLADRVTVLDYGRVIAEGSPRDIAADPEVQRAYLGTMAS